MNNNIPVSKSYENKIGDLVLVCETTDSREELENFVASTNEQIIMNTPSMKRPCVTIVGLPKEYTFFEATIWEHWWSTQRIHLL